MDRLKKLLDDGPSLSGNSDWNDAEKILCRDGLHGFSNKLNIGEHDIYLKTAWRDGQIVRIDITLSRGHKENSAQTARETNLEVTRFDSAKAALESICVHASEMLQSNQVGIGHIINDWIGREMYPSGLCPQLSEIDPETGHAGASFVKGPTDAAARLIRRRLVEWTEIMQKANTESDV